ncbi:MAG: aspartate carbamoyltransferase catalytic subunit [Planctomycetes bacterium]|jgi:aspartate carbamoyltransferase catalytic subunit|nr:aspartate carbamoyltransferase catalytic subunit [Planctomycetota bacterium]
MPRIRHLVSVDDLSISEIQELFNKAKDFSKDLRSWSHLCPGRISASLFYEASTRTRLSFESSMQRLGGGVLTAAEMRTSSAAKGESLADTVRVVSGAYADLIVLRHPSEGAARLAAEFSQVPVINAGDGSHEHPTQTLCDLYTLWIEKGELEGLDVVLAGDLRYSRTIHSFIYALARFCANIVCVPHRGLELPDYVLRRLREEYGAEPVRADASELGEISRESDAVYLTPAKPHQLSLFTDSRRLRVDRVDAVYMTRPQTERHGESDEIESYFQLGQNAMSAKPLREAIVMHPLPRRDEISADLDDDPRSLYFKQAARGVPIRMAILAHLLGCLELQASPPDVRTRLFPIEVGHNPCPNSSCITNTEKRHQRLAFKLTSRDPLRAACGYCSQEIPIRLVGCSTTRHYHPRDSASARRIRPDHLVFFRDEAQATALGFSATR